MTKKKRLASAPVTSLIPDAFSIMSDLREELENWKDSLPENLQNGTKAEELDTAIGELEQPQEIDLDEELTKALDDLAGEYPPLRGGRRASRADRRDEAVGMLRAAEEMIREKIERLSESDEKETSLAERLEQLADECVEAADTFDGVEFPRMF